MDIEALVRTITQEVLKQLQGPKPCIMILGPKDDTVAAQVRERLDEQADIVFFGEILSTQTPVRYIVPRLSCGDMADLAAGKASSLLLSKVLDLLLHGVAVETLAFEYHEYASTASHALFALYAGYEKQLATYGLTLLGPKRPEVLRVHHGLITEKTVLDAAEQGTSKLLVPLSAVITPLAAETATTLRLRIEKQS